MKCPKCGYLGFETGDRCKHCGYDFSLLSAAPSQPDYDLRITLDDEGSALAPGRMGDHDPWLGARHEAPITPDPAIDAGLTLPLTPASMHPPTGRIDTRVESGAARLTSAFLSESAVQPARLAQPAQARSALPLFTPGTSDDDEPLIKLPVAPRPPLQVRRTPDTPGLRALSRQAPPPIADSGLQFSEEQSQASLQRPAQASRTASIAPAALPALSTPVGARLMAAAIDVSILLGIDFAVLYFTVRMAGLTMGEWDVLPIAPLVTFLALLKLSYFYAFTAVGGQTIGKMAAGTCVVAEDGGDVDAAQAMRRTCAGMLSVLLLGVGLVPALFGDRRALHDRLAHTRVVPLRSA